MLVTMGFYGDSKIEPKAFAFSVALKAPCVDQLLFGVDSKAQLEELMNCSVISSERIASGTHS